MCVIVEYRALYQVCFARPPRRVWRVEEAWSAVATRSLPRRPRPATWRPVGTLAAAAARNSRWAERIRGLVQSAAGALAIDPSLDGARSLFSCLADGQPVLGWLLREQRDVFVLSALLGAYFGMLRVCTRRRCEKVFLAATRAGRLCEVCDWAFRAMPMSKRQAWGSVKDRLRKRPGGVQQLQDALEDLYAMSLEKWRRKWDHRSKRGRKPGGKRK